MKAAIVTEPFSRLRFQNVKATQIIRPLRGISRDVIVFADDNQLYIVKFAEDPDGPNRPANQVLGEHLCAAIGLPTSEGAFVQVPQYLLDTMGSLKNRISSSGFYPRAGVHYGTRYPGSLDGGNRLFDIMPTALIPRITNRSDFLGMCILDIWANHQGHRQAVFRVSTTDNKITATFIDHGNMFGGPQNSFDDSSCRAFYLNPDIYAGLFDTHIIERWKKKIFELAPAVLLEPLDHVPQHWFNENHKRVRMLLSIRIAELDRLIEPFLAVLRRYGS